MGLKMSETLKLVVDAPFEVPPPPTNLQTSDSNQQFSISILGLDSTSRAQFERHMRKTKNLIDNMGGVTFEAYNKIGDNSAVNLLPILADELQETRNFSRLDSTGDIDLNKILPSKTSLDPDAIEWIWKQLPTNYVTMYNDDIMHTARGLFHYPPENFMGGFGKEPARFYYRPYYNHLYSQLSNWWRKCLDGEFLAEVFIDSWFRFERVFAKIPHFGFTFISSLTHDDPSNLELLDHTLFHRLAFLLRTGVLENTVLIILGDHGNRVHPLNRYTFAGKIEERAPFLNIIVPPRFRRMYADKYETLKQNSQRVVSNFDLHATLKFLVDPSKQVDSRGTSLFEVQNSKKSCQDNGVINNHCLCMVDASQDISKVPNPNDLANVLKAYITNFKDCFKAESLKCGNVTETLMPNNYVQVWARTKISDSEVRRKKTRGSSIVYPYMTCHVESSLDETVELLTQFRLIQFTQEVTIAFPPRLTAPFSALSSSCSYFQFPTDYCKCVDLQLAV
ncbi:unnamed protein product [Caenorhabditis sp. 36 PRJEB53466]|nr:unnamed protein product [Caenorhabditis sp. 36 PRJEB53466]